MAILACSIDDCEAPHSARGYCRTHYSKLWLGKERPAIECKADGCTNRGNGPGCGRGYCNKHYYRVYKHGDENGGKLRGGEFEERIGRLVEKNSITGCWNWIGSTNHNGYGRIMFEQKPQMAHRVTYSHYKGEIPEGLSIDHLCNNRACVNPDHLEAVSHGENTRRRDVRMQARDAGKQRKRLNVPNLMTIDEFAAWAVTHGHDISEVRVSHGFVMTE
jgi:hypothetical protein